MFRNFLLINLLLLLITAPVALSDISETAHLYLNIVNSPRATGMGGTTVNLVDEQSAFYNPGAFGLFCFDKIVSISLPSNTTWLPELADDIRLKTWSIGGSYTPNRNSKVDKNKLQYSVGVTYARKTIDYGTIYYTSEDTPYILGSFESYDKARFLTLSIGIDYYIRVGIGYTNKKLNSFISRAGAGTEIKPVNATGTAHDIGILVEFPLNRLLNMSPPSENSMFLELTPSLAFVQANMGDPITYFDAAQSDPLPKIRRIGFGLKANLVQNSTSIVNFLIIHEKEKDLVNNFNEFRRIGLEVGFLESVYIRRGVRRDEYYDADISSFGFGVSLRGLLSAFSSKSNIDSPNGTMDYITQNIDLKFDWSKWSSENNALDNTKFLKFNLSI